MKMKRRIILQVSSMIGITTLLVSFLGPGMAASPAQPGSSSCNSFGVQRVQERKEAPPFALRNLDGNQVSLSDFKGKPVLVTFWATWCLSCQEEMPLVEKFSQDKRDQLAILLIAIDGERKKAVQTIVNKNKITLPVLLLLKEKVMDQYGVRGWIPLTFLIDQKGILIGKIVGQRDWGSAEAWPCLKELFELR